MTVAELIKLLGTLPEGYIVRLNISDSFYSCELQESNVHVNAEDKAVDFSDMHK